LREVFVDRAVELSVLEREYKSNGFRLVVVYGRRRIGKTRLLLEFLREIGGVYYLARLSSHVDNLVGLARSVDRVLPGFSRGKRYTSLDAVAGFI